LIKKKRKKKRKERERERERERNNELIRRFSFNNSGQSIITGLTTNLE
jgi:hypothetical protein